jgi:hypothetical protein
MTAFGATGRMPGTSRHFAASSDTRAHGALSLLMLSSVEEAAGFHSRVQIVPSYSNVLARIHFPRARSETCGQFLFTHSHQAF